ncbi:MAG: PrsW family intramembrane metalloprotease, partial [Anaerolineae bacterium]
LDGVQVTEPSGDVLYVAVDTVSGQQARIFQALQEAGAVVEGMRRYDGPRDFLYQRAWSQARDRLWDAVAGKRVGPLIEEVSKGLVVLLLFLGLRREFDGPLDGIVYGGLVGLGFAVTENALFMITRDPQSQFLHRIVMRGLSGHATYTALTGLGLGLARAHRDRPVAGLLPVTGFVAALVAHTSWNSFNAPMGREVGFFPAVLMLNGPFVILVALGLYLSWRQEDRVIRDYLPHDLYDSTTYAAAPDLESARARRRARQRARQVHGRGSARLVSAIHRALIEIAFWHWRADRFGLEPTLVPDLTRLRQQVLDLRARLVGD